MIVVSFYSVQKKGIHRKESCACPIKYNSLLLLIPCTSYSKAFKNCLLAGRHSSLSFYKAQYTPDLLNSPVTLNVYPDSPTCPAEPMDFFLQLLQVGVHRNCNGCRF
jgi:hypothetical protein